MSLTIKLSKADNQPWGFRLSGGADFCMPLTISKVNYGTVAEKAGLLAGDAVVGINGHDALRMKHGDAQNAVKEAGSSFEMVVSRGGSVGTHTIWKPSVTPVGEPALSPLPKSPMPSPVPPAAPAESLPSPARVYTKTSLEATPYESPHIGSSHNVAPKPFGGGFQEFQDNTVKTITNKQFNSPVGLYSEESIAETLSAQAEVLASGVLGVDFKKNEKAYSGDHSEVLKMVKQMDEHPAGADEPGSHDVQSRAFRQLEASLSDPRAVEVSGDRPAGTSKVTPPAPVIRPPGATPTTLTRCAECDRVIDSVFVRVKDKNLHPECFKCATCGCSLRNAGYYNINNKLYCDIHARQAARCNPPAPNVEPVTVPPGGRIPAGAVPLSPLTTAISPIPPPQKFVPGPPPAAPAQPAPAPLSPYKSDDATGAPKVRGYAAVGKPHASGSSGPTPFNKIQAPAPAPVKPFIPAPVAAPAAPVKAPAPAAPVKAPAPPAPVAAPKIDPIPAPAPIPSIISTPPAPAPAAPAPGKGTSAGTSAPRRGKGVMKQPGPRQAICAATGEQIRGPFVLALGKCWDPKNFVCATQSCRRNLQEIGFVEEEGKLYCENCWGQYIAPICSKCNKRVKGDCLLAIGKQFHPECFTCSYCSRVFGNAPFYLEDGLPYCEQDWNELFTTKCVGCGFPIEAGDRWVEALNNNYHSQCFKCTLCGKNLEGQSFYAKGDRPFCKSHARHR